MAANFCNHSGCYCKGYIIPTSKWSKGNCKNCNHSQKEHGDLAADVSYESKEAAKAPISSSEYNAQIDGKMGIVPSGKTNYKDVGGYGGSTSKNKAPSIYSIHLDESDWINWSADDLLVWFQQKKKLPEALKVKSIEYEMRNNGIGGNKMSQLTHSTMLSYGFTEYDHRSRLLAEVKKLLEKHPSSSQTPKYNAINNNNNNNNNNVEQKQEQKQQSAKEDKAEIDLLKEKNLNESQWKTWSTDQVWEWIKIKQGWINTEEMEYLFVHKLNEYEEKLKSKDINLTGARFVDVKNDMKTQKLLKGIGFPFSARKKVYKHIDVLLRHNSN